MVGSDGTSPVTYNYTDYGETEILGNQDFYNEVCYSAGIYDKITGLYYLNARYYSPENGAFLTQDTYRGDRSRTYTLNYYAYCAGNPIAYTDPSGHAIWGVVGAAMGAYDGYKYAKKKKLKGWKKAAAIAGGAALGAVNPFKVVKAAKKVYKAAKYTKNARNSYKKLKAASKVLKKPKTTKVKKTKYKGKTVTVKTKKLGKTTYKKKKTITSRCFVAGTKISTEKGFTPIEQTQKSVLARLYNAVWIVVGTVVVFFSLMMTISSGLEGDAGHFAKLYYNNEYSVVEGTVENLNKDEKTVEYTVNNVPFCVSVVDGNDKLYNQIQKSGENVRISYVGPKGDYTIVKLEKEKIY